MQPLLQVETIGAEQPVLHVVAQPVLQLELHEEIVPQFDVMPQEEIVPQLDMVPQLDATPQLETGVL